MDSALYRRLKSKSDRLLIPSIIKVSFLDWRFVLKAFFARTCCVLVAFAPLQRSTSFQEEIFSAAYVAASYLTDPLCAAHCWLREIPLTEQLYPKASSLETHMRKGCLLAGVIFGGALSWFTIPSGVLLRRAAIALQKRPFLYKQGEGVEKEGGYSLSLLSWNVCCVPGGFAITDGGVLPWMYRLEPLVEAITAQNADMVCLFEIFDILTAHALIEGLKGDYAHFYFHIGPNSVGQSSGLFVASKVKIEEPEFLPFPPEALDGRGKYCQKGVFSFLLSQQEKSIRIYATHLQHSEIPQFPTAGEKKARRLEMELIMADIQKNQAQAVVLTGDLNLDDAEFCASTWRPFFDQGKVEGEGYTWGGDAFCASLVGKTMSAALNLDYALVLKQRGLNIATSFVETGFEGEKFKPGALSDHKGLFSQIYWEKNP